ncbi:MAG TPA: 6-bladed beta-propeller [Gemmatimonadaceae bacterium]|nr:6-bladed beta-propeller [Gemmatimonadaceae bacterium]
MTTDRALASSSPEPGSIRWLRSAGVALLVLAAACDRAPATAAGAPTLTLEPLLEIGTVSGDTAYQHLRIVAIERFDDGSLAVANAGVPAIRVYDAEGRYVRSIGHEGEGPGEYRAISSMLRRGDTLFVHDLGLRRLTAFTADGGVAGTLTLTPPEGTLNPTVVGMLADGRIVAVGRLRRTGIPPDGISRDSAAVLVFARDGIAADTVAFVAGHENEMYITRSSSSIEIIKRSRDFHRDVIVRAAGSKVYIGATDDRMIAVHDLAAGSVSHIRWGEAPPPIAADFRERYIDTEVAELSPAEQTERRASLANMPLPPSAPAFDQMRVDGKGQLWVREYAPAWSEPGAWLVLDASGATTATFTAPRDFVLQQVLGDTVVAVGRDEVDVEFVREFLVK